LAEKEKRNIVVSIGAWVFMSKTHIFPVAAATLLAALLSTSPLAAQGVPELTAKRTLDLPGQSASDKAPVVTGVAMDPSGKYIAAVGDDHQVRLWDARTQKSPRVLSAHNGWVRAASFRPDGKVLATAGDDRQICLWEASSGALLRSIPNEPFAVRAMAFNSNGRSLASAGFGDKVRIHDSDDGRLLQELEAPGGDVRALVYSPDGARLAAAGRNGAIRLWDAKGKQLADLQSGNRAIDALAYSPDGALLAAAGAARNIGVWDAAKMVEKYQLPDQGGAVLSLCFCGRSVLAAGNSVNAVRVWSLPDEKELNRLSGHTGSVAALVWNANSGQLLSGGFDCTVRFWEGIGE
jgi:WD40 repeat protein